jgi:hypothetical protein
VLLFQLRSWAPLLLLLLLLSSQTGDVPGFRNLPRLCYVEISTWGLLLLLLLLLLRRQVDRGV